MATLDVAALRAHDPRAMRELDALCRKCARVGAAKVSAHEFIDDIVQEMMLMVLGKFVGVYDGVSEVDAFLVKTARLMGLGFLRKHSKEVLVSVRDGDERADILHEHADESAQPLDEALDDRVTREQAVAAKQRLIDRIREKQAAQAPIAAAKARPAAIRPAGSNWESGNRFRASKETPLRLARHTIGLTQSELADELAVSVTTLRRLESEPAIPRDIKKRMAKLLKDERLADPANKAGTRRINKWAKRLGIDPGDTVALADEIGVHRATVFRWKTGKSVPPPHIVRRVDAIVSVVSERKQRLSGKRSAGR